MENLLFSNVLSEINKAMTDVSVRFEKLTDLSHDLNSENNFDSEEYEMEELVIKSTFERINISFCIVIESLGLMSLLSKYQSDYAALGDSRTKQSLVPYTGEWENETMRLFWRYYKVLSSLLFSDDSKIKIEERKSQLENVLRNTPYIIKQWNIEPHNETEVKKCVYNTLIHTFPDVVKEMPISKETKTYKPDIGIKSIKSAIEYKFADTSEEVKKALGGIYEDIQGYSGSEDWNCFYAVIYMTEMFYTTEQIMSEFPSSRHDWKLILVYGKGSRKSK